MFHSVTLSKELEHDTISWRRVLHQIPETGNRLPLTKAFVIDVLDRLQVPYREYPSTDGLSAVIEGHGPGKTLALRADMDALPISEETDLPFRSTNGCMHACAHDVHTAILLSVAKLLKGHPELFRGRVKLIFQTGEEGDSGASLLIKDGVLDHPKVDGLFACHAGKIPPFGKKGQVILSRGPMMAATHLFELTVYGKGCHGATPTLGIDPIVIGSQIVSALQALVSRESSINEPVIITIGSFHGGTAHNVIPDAVVLQGTLRTLSEKSRIYMKKRIVETASLVAESMRGSITAHFDEGYPAVINDKNMAGHLIQSAVKVLGRENVLSLPQPVMIGEDVSCYMNLVPGCFFFLYTNDPDSPPHHSASFTVDESMLHLGTAVLFQAAVDWLNTR